MDLAETAAAYVIGQLVPERLPEVAQEALDTGLDSPSLAVLAMENTQADARHLRDLFEAALRELGTPIPSLLEACHCLKQLYIAKTALGTIAPSEGASFIVNVLFESVKDLLPPGRYVGESFGIGSLVYLSYAYDDVAFGDAKAYLEIDRDVVEECIRLTEHFA